jgi:hypothetical protein
MGFFDKFETNNPATNTKAVVNVEWVLKTLDNTIPTYSAGTGLSLSGTTFSINTASSITITGKWNVPTPALPS